MMKSMRLPLTLAVLAAPACAGAASGIVLQKSVFVERLHQDGAGRAKRVVEPAHQVTSGDKVIFMMTWRNTGTAPKHGFHVTNAVPAHVTFQAPDDRAAQLSVDSGRHWGALDSLQVQDRETGLRRARPEDVTHIRWAVNRTVPAGASGTMSFRGIVR